MASLIEIMQLCRLCLVKDQVNIPIFEEQGDIRQIFLKISACLPVKVSREDNLPKKICDTCSSKLESLYQFWNTSANSEKQLLKWLSQVGVEKTSGRVAQSHSINSDGVVLKQEVVELADTHSVDDDLAPDDLNISNDAHDYILQQQQLPYQPLGFQFQQDGFTEGEGTSSTSGPSATVTSEAADAPKRKRRAAAMKALPSHIDSEEEDEDDVDMVETKIAKTEEQTDESGAEDPEPTAFVGVPSTSADNEQPGPSGVGKGAAEATFDPLTETMPEAAHQTIYECEVCNQIFSTKKDFLAHHMNQFGETFRCCRCDDEFKTTTELYNHYETHKNGTIIIENEEEEEESTEFDYSENVEAVMNIPNEPINDTDELLYILDGSQCINEVVIEEECEGQEMEAETTSVTKPENFTIVQVEHGYMLPSVFKGQLESKRRYKKRGSDSATEGFVEDDNSGPETVVKPEATSSRSTYVSPVPKSTTTRPKRRHEVPDFSATNYIVLNPNEEVDMPHYKCLRCEQLFISKFTFFRHIEKGKCYINSCDVCSASFTRNSEFYEHYLAEHTDRAICNFCFRTFMYEKNVKEHMLRHLDQFRHRCEECNKGFYTVREYRNHYKNRHMGIRHKCDVCGRSFADEYYFKRHVATHEKALATKVELSVYK